MESHVDANSSRTPKHLVALRARMLPLGMNSIDVLFQCPGTAELCATVEYIARIRLNASVLVHMFIHVGSMVRLATQLANFSAPLLVQFLPGSRGQLFLRDPLVNSVRAPFIIAVVNKGLLDFYGRLWLRF